ncbi:MAG TPA: NAD(P)H-binding protein [Sandaracinaceae bacterium LLY-WYZ-13_1]|nr:NAD(P)H-binding protein [Sandaracinaceae bacterium LLY-WYZ-13_1]
MTHEPGARKGRLVVCGATGYLGGHVARAAHDAGWRVRALARDPARLAPVRDAVDEVFEGHATDPASVAGLFDGADAAFSSIGVRHFGRSPTIWDVDRDANLHLLEEAARAGVGRFAFVSVFRGPELRDRLAVAEAREAVVDALRSAVATPIVVRPNGFFDDMAEIFAMAARGRVWTIGSGRTRFNPIHGADLAEVVVEAIDAGEPAAIDVGGPEVLTMREVGALAFDALGRPARYGRVPVGLVRALAAAARPFSPNAATFLRMFAVLGAEDVVAPARGHRRLAAEMRRLATRAAIDR